MPDEFVETSSESWFGRMGDALLGVVLGIVAVPGAMVLLFWNESRAVHTEKSLQEGAATVISVPAETIVPANEQKLIYLTGKVAAGGAIRDPIFNVSVAALRLSRHVEMYQWKQETKTTTRRKPMGGMETETQYLYTKSWSARSTDSSRFRHPEGHINPRSFPIEAALTLSSTATLGAFRIPGEIIAKMPGEESLAVGSKALALLPASLQASIRNWGEGLYFGADPDAPQVGDLRITFEVLEPGPFSMLARQTGGTLAPYTTHEGREIERVEAGTVTAPLMFQHAESENQTLTWWLRLAGFLIMWVGVSLLVQPCKLLVETWSWFVGAVELSALFFSLTVALCGSLIVIAVAWVAVRPLLGGALLVVAGAAILHSVLHVRRYQPVPVRSPGPFVG